jgi:hypothetical protein
MGQEIMPLRGLHFNVLCLLRIRFVVEAFTWHPCIGSTLSCDWCLSCFADVAESWSLGTECDFQSRENARNQKRHDETKLFISNVVSAGQILNAMCMTSKSCSRIHHIAKIILSDRFGFQCWGEPSFDLLSMTPYPTAELSESPGIT